jgi:hypothetical protein
VTENTYDALLRLMKDGTPGKRVNKNRSGRTGRKQYQAAQAISRAGGTADLIACALEGPEGVFRDLCHTVPSTTGFVDGEPFRSPSGHRSSGAQRGV